jgi:hypothetical protein
MVLIHVAPKASHPGNAVRQVHFLLAAELLALIGAEEQIRHRLGIDLVEPFLFRCHDERTADAHHRVAADLEVQVGRSAGDGGSEKFVDVHSVRSWAQYVARGFSPALG